MKRAIWNNTVIAESNITIVVEGNHYFPPDLIKNEFLVESNTKTVCPWKGTASYYHLEVENKVNKDAAWYYPETKPAAGKIKKYIAFWKGVETIDA
ncbi:DUF427 domain-containing protein [soil metagenome]